LLLVVGPVVITIVLLMGKFAPGAVSAIPWQFIPAVFFVPTVALALISARSLWQRGIR
jgi:hypothetical protein